jgi:hypothetical protein
MRENILLVCLMASALVNFWLLWLCSRWSKFAGILQKQCDDAWGRDLITRIDAPPLGDWRSQWEVSK